MGSKKRELAKNTIILAVGKICTQFISFCLLPLYTSVLDTTQYGIVDVVNTYTSLLVPVITLQLESAIFRFLIDKRDDDRGKTQIVTNALSCCFVQILIALVIFVIICNIWTIEYELLIAFNILAVIFSNLSLQIARGLGDNFAYAIGSFIAAITTIIFNIIFLTVFKMGAAGMLLSTVIANLLCTIFIMFKDKVYKYISVRTISKNQSKKLLKYSIPLVPNGLSWWVINASDRVIITHFLSVAANGIYAISNKFSGVFIGIYYIFDKSWSESASINIEKPDASEFFTETINTMLKLFASVCLGIIAAMPFVFPIMINEQYAESYQYIPILMVATLFNVIVSLISVVYIAKKLTKEIAKTSAIAAVVNIVVNIILIKIIGIYAAALSTLIAFVAMAIYRYIDVQRYLKIIISKKLIISLTIAFAIVIAVYYINNILLHIITFLAVIVFAIILNYKFLKSVIKIILNKYKNIINRK